MEASRHMGELFIDKFPRLVVIGLWIISLVIFVVILGVVYERGKQGGMQENIKATSRSVEEYQRRLAKRNEQVLKTTRELMDKLAKGNLP